MKIITGIVIYALCSIQMILLLPSFSEADENENSKTLSPCIFINNGDPSVDKMSLKDTRTEVTINGVIADVRIVQNYKNEGTRPDAL